MPEQLAAFALQAQIEAALPESAVTVLEEVGSTNQWLLDTQPNGDQDHFCLALQQRTARGRRGKGWESPPGNFYGSASLVVDTPASALGPFSLAVACALADTLEALGVSAVQLKWPNDVHVAGRKLAGILLELPAAPQPTAQRLQAHPSPQRVVVGVGINVEPMTADVGQTVTSLRELLGAETPTLENLASAFWPALRDCRSQFKAEGFAAFVDTWQRRDVLSGRDVTVTQGPTAWRGRALGVAADGCLRVHSDGAERLVNAGEVSVRPA